VKKPTKRVMQALERVLAAEVMGDSYQMRPSKLRDEMVAEGLISNPYTSVAAGWPQVDIHNLVDLTDKGRRLYCEFCEGGE
jgi:hypothetical protein